jgi:hypothetical protein
MFRRIVCNTKIHWNYYGAAYLWCILIVVLGLGVGMLVSFAEEQSDKYKNMFFTDCLKEYTPFTCDYMWNTRR